MKTTQRPPTRLLPALGLLLLGLAAPGCATDSDRSWIGHDVGRISPPSSAVPADPSGAATR